jgi:hypothetical protein
VSATARDSLGNVSFCAFAVVVEASSPAACDNVPTFASVTCRLETLGPTVTATTTGRVQSRLSRVLGRARDLVRRAETLQAAGRAGPTRVALRKSVARMARFRRTVLAPKSGLDESTRATLQGRAEALAADLRILAGS